jgi:agmatinase
VLGLAFDTGLAVRSGARFGPRAVREASLTIRPAYNPAQRVAGFTDRSLTAMQEAVDLVVAAGAVPLGIGGDHTVTLAELRAVAKKHGPVALLHFGAHTDCLEESAGQRHIHSTVVRRAVEEGVVDPSRSALFGMRGGLDSPDEYDQARELGFTVVPWEDLAQLGTGMVAATVEAAAGAKAFVTVDVDFVDPAFAPAVGTPESGGPSSMQALTLIRACRGLDLAGADVVEVVPELDSSNLTATFAAAVGYELLSLMACGPRGGA